MTTPVALPVRYWCREGTMVAHPHHERIRDQGGLYVRAEHYDELCMRLSEASSLYEADLGRWRHAVEVALGKAGMGSETALRFAMEHRQAIDAPKWRRPDVDPPADEQLVLCYWAPNSVHSDPIYESLTYYAADAPDSGEAWADWTGERGDTPDLWAPLEALGVPK
jgi:hypothetical protein